MGDLENCEVLPLTTRRFEQFRASFLDGDNSIQYFKEGIKKTYGEMPTKSGYTNWKFSDQNRLIGLHGRVQSGVITQLGVITVSEECGDKTVPLVTEIDDQQEDTSETGEESKTIETEEPAESSSTQEINETNQALQTLEEQDIEVVPAKIESEETEGQSAE